MFKCVSLGAHMYAFLLRPCRSGKAGASVRTFSFKDPFSFSTWFSLFTLPPAEYECSGCSIPLSVLDMLRLSRPGGCVMVYHCSLICISLMINEVGC